MRARAPTSMCLAALLAAGTRAWVPSALRSPTVTSGAALRPTSITRRGVRYIQRKAPAATPARRQPVVRRAAHGSVATAGPPEATTTAADAVASAPSEGGDQEAAKPKVRDRVLSGVQPTGNLHLGNYLGAIRQWVKLSEATDAWYCVVDLHAITVPHDPKQLARNSLDAAATYIAAGVDPSVTPIFVQSHVSAHAELTWLLNCLTPMNWLERMIQYKEKAVKQGENVGVGLFDYPVLMAADILLYQASLVPVGEDQRQHLELTRDVARRFNDQFCKKKKRKVFKEPKALIVEEGARVMSLTDGTSKMSKSAELDASRINLLDSPDVIAKKIKRCKTDTYQGLEWDNPDRPECANLLNIYQAVTDLDKDAILAECADLTWGQFKPRLADAVVAHLEPIQTKYRDVVADEAGLRAILRDGRDKADQIATETLDAAKDAAGFLSRD